jgi:hypothetical protein
MGMWVNMLNCTASRQERQEFPAKSFNNAIIIKKEPVQPVRQKSPFAYSLLEPYRFLC